MHAFRLVEDEIHLLLQIGKRTLVRVMQSLMTRLKLRLRKQGVEDVKELFPQRYQAVLIEPDEHLLTLIRYIHWHAQNRSATSHQAYTGAETIPWLTTQTALAQLSPHLDRAHKAYMTFMQSPPSIEETEAIEAALQNYPAVLGDSSFVRKLPGNLPRRSTTTIDSLARSICKRMGAEYEQVRSKSRRHELSRVRAVIAHQAIERGIGTLAMVSRYFGRKPPSMRVVIDYYLRTEPELFDTTKVPHIAPILPFSVVEGFLQRGARAALKEVESPIQAVDE